MTTTSREEVDTSFHDDRRSQLYGSLITFLVINNIVITSRFYVHYRSQYITRRKILVEDVFALLGAVRVARQSYLAFVVMLTRLQKYRFA